MKVVKQRPTVFLPYPRRLESITVCRCPRLQKQSVFLRIQVRASIQTKGLERGYKRRARLERDAKGV